MNCGNDIAKIKGERKKKKNVAMSLQKQKKREERNKMNCGNRKFKDWGISTCLY